jgi:hypothetical protein
MIFRHPKQHLSQSTELAIRDGPNVIIFDDGAVFCFCPDCASITCVDDETIKLAILEEEIDDNGVNAEEDTIGIASHPFFPFVLSPFGSTPFLLSCCALPTISASSNSSNGLTGNK